MAPLLAHYLNEQRLIQFEVEVMVVNELMDVEQFEIKDIDINKIQLGIEIVVPRIRVSLPFDYLYAVMHADNRADKMLLKAVLQGIVDYILASANKTALNANIIAEVVEQTLQPAGAKMLRLVMLRQTSKWMAAISLRCVI